MKRYLSRLLALLIGAPPVAAISCQEQETVLFEVGPAPSTTVDMGSQSCADSTVCPNGWLCVKTDCAATRGVCEPPPVDCESQRAPVCGCDGVTYWNDCIRRQSLSPASSPGECRGSAERCETASDCSVLNAACAQLMPAGRACDLEQTGTCWVLPNACDETLDSARWLSCEFVRRHPGGPGGFSPNEGPDDPPPDGFPGGGQAGLPVSPSPNPAVCKSTCAAIREGGKFVRVPEIESAICD